MDSDDFLEQVRISYLAGVQAEANRMSLEQAAKAVVDAAARGDGFDAISEHIDVLEAVLDKQNPDIVKFVTAIQEVADKTLQKAQAHSELNMRGMYLRDAGDYLYIASHLQDGEVDKAAYKACRLDTAARDEIPRDVWEFLSGRYHLLMGKVKK